MANCEACWQASHVDPQTLIQMIGTDGNVYDSFVEITSKLACRFCEAPISRITITNLNSKPFEPVSCHEALMHALELGAFCRARDGVTWKDPRIPTGSRRARRVRKFGRG